MNIKLLIATTLISTLLSACGGGGNDSPNTNSNGGATGNTSGNQGGTTNGGATNTGNGGTTNEAPVGGQTGLVGDAGNAEGGLLASSKICAADAPQTYTGWSLNGNTWCLYPCPANAENDDGDAWGSYLEDEQRYACLDANLSAGTTTTAPIFAPINGCPSGGCPGTPEYFPRVYVASAFNPTPGTYNCAAKVFNERTQNWEDDSIISAFTISFTDDNNAVDGQATTWSFSDGVLSFETGRVLNNIAQGNGSFSSWNSNTSVVRCTS